MPDLTDLESPTSNARLDSFGTSSAQADIGNLNGIAKLPGLICLAAGGCDSFPAPAERVAALPPLSDGLVPSPLAHTLVGST